MESVQFLFQNVSSFFGSFSLAPTYVQAGAIIVLIFLLIVSMAQFRHHFVHWTLKGGLMGLFFGALLTLILEGFLLVGGKTVLISLFGWDKAPKPISTALDIGKERLTNVLGAEDENKTSKDVIQTLQSLNPDEIKKVKAILCVQ